MIPPRPYENPTAEPYFRCTAYQAEVIQELIQAYAEHSHGESLFMSPTFNRCYLRLLKYLTRPVSTTDNARPMFTFQNPERTHYYVGSRTVLGRFLKRVFNETAYIWQFVEVS